MTITGSCIGASYPAIVSTNWSIKAFDNFAPFAFTLEIAPIVASKSPPAATSVVTALLATLVPWSIVNSQSTTICAMALAAARSNSEVCGASLENTAFVLDN